MPRRFYACIVTVVIASGFVLAPPRISHAHHSFAMFDFDKTDHASASVEEFRWTNPHVVLVIRVDAKPAESAQLWSLELTSPGNLTRIGWNRHSFKAGDRIEVDYNPLRDGHRGGAFRKATIVATGQVLESNLRAQEKPGLQ